MNILPPFLDLFSLVLTLIKCISNSIPHFFDVFKWADELEFQCIIFLDHSKGLFT